MKSIRAVSVVLGIFCIANAFAADKHDAQRAELEAIKAELKPLRERAYLEADVVAARKALDAAYRAYWDSVRAAMIRLEPAQQKLIEKEVALRMQLSAVRPAASPSPTPKPKKESNKSSD